MEFTYSFGFPNVQRIMAITEGINNSQTGEKYQIDYRGKYRPLPVIEVPIEMLVYRIENIRTKSLQKQWNEHKMDVLVCFGRYEFFDIDRIHQKMQNMDS